MPIFLFDEKKLIIVIPNMSGMTCIDIVYSFSLFSYLWFNTGMCINNYLFLWYITSDSRYFSILNSLNNTSGIFSSTNSNSFYVTLHATKTSTFVHGKEYLWCHKWLFPSWMYFLIHMKYSSYNGPLLLLKPVYSLQNLSMVWLLSSSNIQWKMYLIT